MWISCVIACAMQTAQWSGSQNEGNEAMRQKSCMWLGKNEHEASDKRICKKTYFWVETQQKQILVTLIYIFVTYWKGKTYTKTATFQKQLLLCFNMCCFNMLLKCTVLTRRFVEIKQLGFALVEHQFWQKLKSLHSCVHGRRKGGQDPLDFEIISKKRLFFQFRGVKNKFNHFWPPPWKKFWENRLLAPPWKKSFRRPWLCLAPLR